MSEDGRSLVFETEAIENAFSPGLRVRSTLTFEDDDTLSGTLAFADGTGEFVRCLASRLERVEEPAEPGESTTMINGAHAILSSTSPEADRAFLRDVLELPHVDAGEGWLIFALPPAEVAVHPADTNDRHQLYFLCEDVEAFVASMTERGVPCSPIEQPGWGALTHVTLPGGGRIGVYQPRHARP